MITGSEHQSVLSELWTRHRQSMIERADRLRSAAADLRSGTLAEEQRAGALSAAHQLAGTLGTFGFSRASDHAREIDDLLRNSPASPTELAERIDLLLDGLYTDLETRPLDQPELIPGPEIPDAPLVLFVDDDEGLTGRLADEARRRGLTAAVAATTDVARALIDEQLPAAVVLDLTLGDCTDAAYALLDDLTERFPGLPVLVFSVRDGFTDRIEVARRGGRGFLDKTLTTSDALDVVVHAIKGSRAEDDRVLAVDDDPTVLAMTRAILEGNAIEVTTLQDPLLFWDELKRVSPSLLLLDLEMPGLNGVELCRVLRNDPRWASVPILVLTARRDEETIQSVFAAGADDFLGKPIKPDELVTRVRNRLNRFRLHRSLADNDALTGVANRRTSGAELSQLLRLAQRFGKPVCLAELDLDHFKAVNDRYGHATGDAVLRRLAEVLRRSVRGEDVVARWGGEEFVLGMYGLTREAGVNRVRELLELFGKDEFGEPGQRFRLTFSAGVAQFPVDGQSIEALYGAADEALYRAKAAGRNQVMGASDKSGNGQERVDVVVVEDEEATGDVLTAAVSGAGLAVRRFTDGAAALAALAGDVPAVRARVILLDVELGAVDGFTVLERLREDGVLRDTKVLMLTGRAGEDDVLRALALDAFDHVAKPFSVPVLLHKVTRALER